MKKIPVLVCVDIEPDEREIDANIQHDWEGFEKTCEFFRKLRPCLKAATGSPVSLSWFLRMDPQIAHVYGSAAWVVRRYSRLIEEVVSSGDEVGLHTHPWRWDENRRVWISDYGNQEWIEHCVRLSFAAFRESLKQPCLSFRFGDHWMNNATSNLVETLGARFDLTVEPGQQAGPAVNPHESFTGALPDYTRVPQKPYRPSKADFRKPGGWHKRRLWIIPVSAGPIVEPLAPSDRSLIRASGKAMRDLKRLALRSRAATWLGAYQNAPGEYMTLNLGFDSHAVSQVMDRLLSESKSPYLALVARTDVSIDPAQRANLEQTMDRILSHPLIGNFVFETPAEVIKRFD